jgi:hypothetical protein
MVGEDHSLLPTDHLAAELLENNTFFSLFLLMVLLLIFFSFFNLPDEILEARLISLYFIYL